MKQITFEILKAEVYKFYKAEYDWWERFWSTPDTFHRDEIERRKILYNKYLKRIEKAKTAKTLSKIFDDSGFEDEFEEITFNLIYKLK